jgi:hypothetical protein
MKNKVCIIISFNIRINTKKFIPTPMRSPYLSKTKFAGIENSGCIIKKIVGDKFIIELERP